MKAITLIARVILVPAVLVILGCSGSAKEETQKAERHIKSATAYHKQGQLRAAMLEAKNAVQLRPGEPAAYEILASIYNEIGAFGLTQSIPVQVVEKSVRLKLELAEAQVANKKYRTAGQTLESLGDSSAGHSADQVKLWSEIYLYTNDIEALDVYLAQIEQSQEPELRSLAEYYRAVQALTTGKADQAEVLLNNYIANNPANREAMILRGDVAMQFNRLDEAEKYYTQALSGMPSADMMLAERASLLRRLINTLSQQGRTGEAFTYQKILSDANPDAYVAQQKFEQAMQSYLSGDNDAAAAILTELHEQYPKDKHAGTLLGIVAQKQGDNALAAELFSQFIDEETASPLVIQAATIAKLSASQPDEAISMLKEACRLQPDNAEIWAIYGMALTELKVDPKEAARALERSLALSPDKSRLRVALAGIYGEQGKESQALAQLAKAYEVSGDDFLVQQAYFRMLALRGEMAKVETLIKDYIATNPDSPQASYLSGWVHGTKGEYRQAEKQFERAVAQADSRLAFLSHAALAEVHNKLNEPVKVTKDWESAIVVAPGSAYAYQQWLLSLYRRNIIDSAAERLAALNIPDTYWQPDFAMASLYMRQKNYDRAIQLTEKILERQSEIKLVKDLAAQAHQALAFEAYGKKDITSTKSHLVTAAGLAPDNMAYVANLIKVELEADNVEGAQALLGKFGESKSDQATRAYLQGKIFEHQSQMPEALSAYRESWQHSPTDFSAQAVFDTLRKSGQDAKATLFLDDWQNVLPGSSQPLIFKAMQAQTQNDNPSAKAYYLKALELNQKQPVVLNNLAWIVQPESADQAVEYARRAYELAPESAAIIDTLGWMLVEANRIEEGLSYLERAGEQAPGDAEIKTHINTANERLKNRQGTSQ